MNKGLNLERIIGLLHLIPPVLSVFLFILKLLFNNIGDIPEMSNLISRWTGHTGILHNQRGGSVSGGGYTSAVPIYFGLLAIAGAVLLTNRVNPPGSGV